MRTILSFAALAVLGLAIPTTDNDGWTEYKAKFGKVYSTLEEEQMRKEIFMQSKAKVDKHNALFAAGLSTYKSGLNHMSDWTKDEINTRAYGLILPKREWKAELHQLSGKPVPASVDWREQNVVTPVKDQGNCGSCYAFSATGCLEGLLAIKTQKLVSLSEQEIVDCMFILPIGCIGGYPWDIFQRLATKYAYPQGLESESDYPYTGEVGTCRFNYSEVVATDSGFKRVPASEEALKDAVANIGPISVGLSSDGWDSYESGIFNDPSCSSDPKDAHHAVLVVGYGEEDGKAYWIVKNSWGTEFGEKGYIRIALGSNLCGIANHATYPIV